MAATAMAPAALLLSWLSAASLSSASGPALPPPPPPLPYQQPQQAPTAVTTPDSSGQRLRINGHPQQAQWQLLRSQGSTTEQLWLPLEVLQNQLGVSSRSLSSGGLKLEWFGQELEVPPSGLRRLGDEVAVDVAALLQANGVSTRLSGGELQLDMPAVTLIGVRSSRQNGQRRIVLDLAGPALIRRDDNLIWLGLSADGDQRNQLAALGLAPQPDATGLRLQTRPGATQNLFSLGGPPRVVLDLTADRGTPPGTAPGGNGGLDPRLQALLGRELQWEQLLRGDIRLTVVRLDPRSRSLSLRPLTRASSMEGLSSLPQLAAQQEALVAVNGGYFNRVKRLPLGALKVDGRWLSGPILGRGVVAWSSGSMPRFGRLSLDEWLSDSNGTRLPVTVLNSGYLQRGLSRYTADWGPNYRALSGDERALVLRAGQVSSLYSQDELSAGVPLRPGETLVVARGGAELPWAPGDRLNLSSRPSNNLGQAPFVVSGGPLLLQNGRIVLNGAAESFSSGFLRQGAPRTVVASDGRQLWLITLEGLNTAGPSLDDTALVLQQLGLSDALNLDGGSSTGLVLGGVMTVKGRGVVGAIHHGLGVIQETPGRQSEPTARVR